eukprot:CAMPEP_0179103848 /NCGR_PEP_ID=MMETSP0796-20121207/48140_1 /TAXON_ID=73915 /ORGANISM="Pyrodinium bahamense, Strain pbaha01" /LENGTH=100 /DNA_ID=CAMNT_0020801769 /DNA_START=35 /DNA_END=333 /DNA_ORIENTATION=+
MSQCGTYRYLPHNTKARVANPFKVPMSSNVFRSGHQLALHDPLAHAIGPPLYVEVADPEQKSQKVMRSGAGIGLYNTRNGKPGALAEWPPRWVEESSNKG